MQRNGIRRIRTLVGTLVVAATAGLLMERSGTPVTAAEARCANDGCGTTCHVVPCYPCERGRCGIRGFPCCCCGFCTKRFPDDGWNLPVATPIRRQAVGFQSFWPEQFYGDPTAQRTSSAPMIFQPTDTTQLGFTYQNVPQWRPNPAMLPSDPSPSRFHSRRCYDPCGTGCSTCGPCVSGGPRTPATVRLVRLPGAARGPVSGRPDRIAIVRAPWYRLPRRTTFSRPQERPRVLIPVSLVR